jgi:group II intron reverse transcriptase/maturase
MENVRDIMRNPERVLNSLSEHSKISGYKFERLYRVLFNEEMFYTAYQRIYAKTGNMTKGADGQTIDQMSLSRIEKLVGVLRNETYQPNPARRTYIPKKNGKMRPLGIPSFDDKLVQEVIRMMLESIFEKQFENTSHGFRPQRSCHTALIQIQKRFTATKWFIEGDIKGFFDNINHDALTEILKERISDERFIRLIRKFLNAGYIEDWTFHNTYSGTPQGGIISPILANIYLDKLDKYMKEYVSRFDIGKRRERNIEYNVLSNKKARLAYKLENVKDELQRTLRINKIREIEEERKLLPSRVEMDKGYRRLKYVRYADDFLVGVIGSKEDSERIKRDIKIFLQDKLKLELSEDKTLITHANKSAKFLGYEIHISKSSSATKRIKTGVLSRAYGKKVILILPTETMRRKLFDYGVLQMKQFRNIEKWKPQRRIKLIDNDDLEILDTYNAEIRGFHNYYSIAHNSPALHSFRYIMEYSMYKTLANKYRISVHKVIEKFRFNKDFAVFYNTKNGERKMRVFHNTSFKRKTEVLAAYCDNIPKVRMLRNTTSLIDRLKAQQCELCGGNDSLEMHHLKKLKDLKGKEQWERVMIARRRKTMALCQSCHRKIHAGKID